MGRMSNLLTLILAAALLVGISQAAFANGGAPACNVPEPGWLTLMAAGAAPLCVQMLRRRLSRSK